MNALPWITKTIWGWLALCLPILILGCDAGGGGSFEGAGVLRGFVTEFEAEGQVFRGGVEGVAVTVEGTDLEATTADDGFFIISGVPPRETVVAFTFRDTRATLPVTVPENTEVDLKQVRVRNGQAKADAVEVIQLPPPVQAPTSTPTQTQQGSGSTSATTSSSAPAGTSSGGSSTTSSGSGSASGDSGSGSVADAGAASGSSSPEYEPEDDEGEGSKLEAEGLIQSTTGNSITVRGRTFQVTGSTVILDEDEKSIPLSALRPGQDVELKGKLVGGQSIATLIKRRD